MMNEDNILISYAHDKMVRCIDDYIITYTYFLDIRQQALLLSEFSRYNDVKILLYGGFDTAERAVMLFIPQYLEIEDFDSLDRYFSENPEENPLTVIRLKKDSFSTVSHRDYLGALMGLGIKRETTGDILTNDGGADLVVLKSVTPYIMSELKSVGRATVTTKEINFAEVMVSSNNIREETVNVSSMRLDNIISACFRLSRSESSSAILAGSVLVNSLQILKCDKKVSIGDKIVFRSKGKIILKEISGVSKKGRNFIKIDVYG